jgi:hypothetical protein
MPEAGKPLADRVTEILRSIEETAAAIMKLFADRQRQRRPE